MSGVKVGDGFVGVLNIASLTETLGRVTVKERRSLKTMTQPKYVYRCTKNIIRCPFF